MLYCVVSQISLQQLVANKMAASLSTGKLPGNMYNGFCALAVICYVLYLAMLCVRETCGYVWK